MKTNLDIETIKELKRAVEQSLGFKITSIRD